LVVDETTGEMSATTPSLSKQPKTQFYGEETVGSER
jgi:hypothetical protein